MTFARFWSPVSVRSRGLREIPGIKVPATIRPPGVGAAPDGVDAAGPGISAHPPSTSANSTAAGHDLLCSLIPFECDTKALRTMRVKGTRLRLRKTALDASV